MSIYTAGGPYSGFEKYSTKLADPVLRQMDAFTKRVQKIMADALAKPQRTAAFWRSVNRRLTTEYTEARKLFSAWSYNSMPKSYLYSLRDIQKRISEMANVAATAEKSARLLASSRGSTAIVNVLARDATISMANALDAGLKNQLRITKATQQAIVKEWTIDSTVAQSIQEGNVGNFYKNLRMNSSTFRALTDATKEGRVIQAGKRKFSPRYYADLVARTKFHDAQSDAAKEQAKNYGTDLVVISSHNTTTVICQAYEGKTYSISGKNKDFPVLDQSPAFHPNCLHLMYPTFAEAMEAGGYYKGMSDYSKGKTDKPPVPKSFVPVDDRSAA